MGLTINAARNTTPPESLRLRPTTTIATPAPVEIPPISLAALTVPTQGSDVAVTARGGDEWEGEAPTSFDFHEVYYISGELPGGYWLRFAVPVHVWLEAGEFVATQPHLDLHAFGNRSVDAILNLRDTLVDHYASLQEAGDRITPRLSQQRELLEQLIVQANA